MMPTLETARPSRLPFVDVLRGMAMIVMALDHTRIFFWGQEAGSRALATSDLSSFFTRWIPGFCAPIFVSLAGVAAYLQLTQGKSKADLSRFLLKRGVWLILLEATVINFGWFLVPTLPVCEVFWAIGISMVMLAPLIRLPIPIIAAVAVAFVAGHNMFDHIHLGSSERWGNLWHLLHEQGFLVFGGKPIAFVVYPAIPWNGVMALGFCFGKILTLPARRRVRATAVCGALLLVLFIVLRGLNGYGDPAIWRSSPHVASRIKSFLSVTHNPVSLQFCAMSLGVTLLLLAGLDSLLTSNHVSWLHKFIGVYGRAPLIYYLLHIYAIHAATIVLCSITGHDWHGLVAPLLERMKAPLPAGYGVNLPIVYLIWIGIVISLYWPVERYAEYKHRHPGNIWLSYL